MRSLKQHVTQFLKHTLPQRPVSGRSHPPRRRSALQLEALETRLVPTSVSGYQWPNPQLITLSFVPDGTNLGGATSNLFATFNAKFGSSAAWQNQILKAAQVWAQQTNINFSLVPDSGAPIGSGNYQQGDPTMGDIRIAGFNFGSSGDPLALAYMPPSVNNYSLAGDIAFNTGESFNINQTYDLFTVAAHEIGHAVGLYESNLTNAVMYGNYLTRFTALGSDDITGVRTIYSGGNARAYDAYNGSNSSFWTAANLTGLIDANSTVLKTGLDITTTSQKEYFAITAPSTTTGTMMVTIQSSGLSLLAPTLTVYNASNTQIGYVSGYGHYGTTLTLNITGVSPGQQFTVKVGGADSTAFGTGHYALTFGFAGIAPRPVPLPNTQTLNGNPPSGGGGQAMNPTVVQSGLAQLLGNTVNALGGAVQSLTGLLGLQAVGDVVDDLLHNAAGTFDFAKAASPNDRFVAQAYVDLLDRQVDPSGLESWSGALEQGILNRDQVVQGIQNSQEYRTVEVNNAYQQLLGRQADSSSLASFVPFLQQGGTVAQLNAILGGSQEFMNNAQAQDTGTGLTTANEHTVDYLFQKVLNRAADSNGLAGFTQSLNNGATPLAVATAIMSSPEAATQQVNRLYSQFLARSADHAGLDGFTEALLNGAGVEAVVAGMVASDEYFRLA